MGFSSACLFWWGEPGDWHDGRGEAFDCFATGNQKGPDGSEVKQSTESRDLGDGQARSILRFDWTGWPPLV